MNSTTYWKMGNRGGKRDGAGRKRSWHDIDGNPLESKMLRVPKSLTRADIQLLIDLLSGGERQSLIELRKKIDKNQ